MAVRRIKKRETDGLPAAELFLEDVDELVKILLAALSSEDEQAASVRFIIGDREFDSLEDLKVFGGKTVNFAIDARQGRWDKVHLEISRYRSYLDESYGSNKRHVFSEVYDVFKRNSLWWSNSIRSMPEWLSFALWIFLSLSSGITLALQKHPQISSVVLSTDFLIFIGAFAAYYRHSIVHLRYSHEGGARKWIEKHGSSIIIAILSAGAGILLKKLVDHWWK